MNAVRNECLRSLDSLIYYKSVEGCWLFEGLEEEASGLFHSTRNRILSNEFTSVDTLVKSLSHDIASISFLSSDTIKALMERTEEVGFTENTYDQTLNNTSLYLHVAAERQAKKRTNTNMEHFSTKTAEMETARERILKMKASQLREELMKCGHGEMQDYKGCSKNELRELLLDLERSDLGYNVFDPVAEALISLVEQGATACEVMRKVCEKSSSQSLVSNSSSALYHVRTLSKRCREKEVRRKKKQRGWPKGKPRGKLRGRPNSKVKGKGVFRDNAEDKGKCGEKLEESRKIIKSNQDSTKKRHQEIVVM